ncbi:histidine kinase [Micromonospora sp. R77]|uniref:sensor histidine kinase n=1 Tax=Micromonospora sp. R77 TaxID=2925836 RepID=UPI001F61610C|nr:histidine kinase [Micromonospora sp. R77]MCI4066980.1 histidine kinase [Micromonospora sp. R77]
MSTVTAPTQARPGRPARADVLVAAAVWLLDLALFSTAGTDLAHAGAASSGLLLLLGYALLGPVALLWRRTAPAPVFALVWVHAVVGATLVAGYQPVLGALAALYAVGAYAPARWSWLIAPALAPYLVIAANEAWLAGQTDPGRRTAVFVGLAPTYAVVVTGVWAVGRWAGTSRRRLATAERRRAEAAARAVAAERARVSRELHDIVAHSVTVMVLQAGGAGRVLPTDPSRAAEALDHIVRAGQQAVEELRRMLTALGPDAAESADATSTHPGAADVADLVDRMRAGGLRVTLTVSGTPRPVDPSVGLAAYRTVQEALTNVSRHAGGAARATVLLRWGDDLTVEVRDAGPEGAAPEPAAALSTGHGLLGLRERLTVVGGELTATPLPDGGFQVVARLPLATPVPVGATP